MGSYYDAVGLLALCDAIDNIEGIPFKPISPPRTLLLNGSGNAPFTGPLPSPYPPLRVSGPAPAQPPRHPFLTHVPPVGTVSATGSLPYSQSQRLGYQQFVAPPLQNSGPGAVPSAGPGALPAGPNGPSGPGGPATGMAPSEVLVPPLPPQPGTVNLSVVPRLDAPHMHQPVGGHNMSAMGMPPMATKMTPSGTQGAGAGPNGAGARSMPYPGRPSMGPDGIPGDGNSASGTPGAGGAGSGAIVDGFRIEECHVCGRIFKGPKAATHKQQHIRRLHPHMYMPKRGGKRRVM